MIDLTADLTAWLGTPEVRALLKNIVTEAVRDELRAALEDELLDVERAAQMLGMSAGALRKAVERGQVPCERIGNRLRFRRMDLLASGASARRIANVNASAPIPHALLPAARVRRQLAAPVRRSDEPARPREVMKPLGDCLRGGPCHGTRAPDARRVSVPPRSRFATVLVEYLSKSATS